MESKEYKGKIVIADDWSNDFEKPTKTRCLWPTGLPAKEYEHIIGLPVRKYASGYMIGSGLSEFMIMPEVSDDGKVYNVAVESEPVKKPKWATAWRNGEWKKY